MTIPHDERASRREALSLGHEAWRCRICKTWKPVPRMARDCERRDAANLGVPLEELIVTIAGTP